MSPHALMSPEKVKVNRSQLRRKQSALFRRARGRTVVVVSNARGGGGVKYVLDEAYAEELWRNLRAATETLEILEDRKLLRRLLRATKGLDEDVERGRLHSLDEALGVD